VSRAVKLCAALAGVLAVAAAIIVVRDHRSDGYTVTVMLADAGGLESGSNVNVAGATVGRVMSLTVDARGRAVAVLELNRRAAPIGSGARASVEIDGFFGERLVDLTRGDYARDPEPTGSTIPVSHSGVSVRLDDVLDSLDVDAQGALRTFLDEDGTALVGRGQSLQALLQQLPQTLPQLTDLLGQFSSNQRALGQLVDRSDQVVSEVAGQRRYLATLVNSANSALGVLASRRDALGSTLQRAPAALKQAQTTLARLQGTALPLAPAADGLRDTAPSLLTALRELPSFTHAAIPTLNEVAAVAPALDRLAAYGTPIVSELLPVTRELTTYSSEGLSPLLAMLADKGGAANLIGEMEGWARSTQGYDASGHIFRFGASVSAASFTQLLSTLSVPGLPPLNTTSKPSTPASPTASASGSASSPPASGPASAVSATVTTVNRGVANTVNSLLGGVSGTVNRVSSGVTGVVSKLHGGGTSSTSPAASTTSTGTSSHSLGSLLGYLTGK
jgi:phospholipid/cholesterol/gamma-HCH transport system substrate-binding protein